MTLNLGGWIHSFTVTDTQQHKGGYTIYKITSIVFPRSVPQALTCLVVWKRFHEIKRLHRELSRRHKQLQLPGKLPVPTDSSYFKRFDAEVIQRRKEYILELMDIVAQHPALYKCNTFTQFFSEKQSPNGSPLKKMYVERTLKAADGHTENPAGAIADICDELDLPYDPLDAGGINPLDPRCDKEQISKEIKEKTKDEKQQQEHDEIDHPKLCMLTPMASVEEPTEETECDFSDYIYEAALEFSHAVQAEVNLEYPMAHEHYKKGVDLLLEGSKLDSSEERKFIAKAKIAKYLARADDIQTNFLLHPLKKLPFQLSLDSPSVKQLELPWNQLAKYKVLRVIQEKVMLVQCITKPHEPLAIMKGIEKPSSNSLTQSIFLPQQVPYMAQLINYFQSEQKIFLLLKQAEGGRLFDYLSSYKPMLGKHLDNYEELFPSEEQAQKLSLTKESNVKDLVDSSKQLINSVSHTLRNLNMDTNSLDSSGQSPKHCPLPDTCLRQWACELAISINGLHGKGIILRDLHMSNILLGSKGQLMLTYFYQNEGLSSDDNYVHKALSLEALEQHFVAPERPFTFRSDWWSYGVVLYHLLVGVSFKSLHPGQLELYSCVQYPAESFDISDNAKDLLEQLLQLQPEQRLDYDQIMMHTFFEGLDWLDVLAHGNGM
ncbi:ribosomal protein S6 kinase-like 1 [Drosophila tropicalis]|uniref:ribosomal protein S6 kinase-like 1 n=1 Tax=Drosophila tropicalis TaxID=46794 RepID=UPI0035ABEA29